jgi:peptidoglycan/xylan/chitin deacetylase (PgdA/CDA1 family)
VPGLGTAAAWALPALAPLHAPLAARLGLRTRLDGTGVALTFDDGPHAQGTPAMLEILGAAGVRATFFMVGEQVERNPSLAGEVAAAGHAIAIHGHRHRTLLRLSPRALGADLDRAREVIPATHALHRPPYGIYSAPAIGAVRERGWAPVLWSRWGRDWRRWTTPERIAAKIGQPQAGDILLLHDADDYSAHGSWRRTAGALPRIIDAVHSAGLAFAQLDDGR